MDVRSQLKNAQIEQRATAPTKKSEIVYNTVSNKTQIMDNSSAKNVVTEDGTAILSGKSIDADTNTITNIEDADIKAAAAIALNKLAATTVSRALVSDASGFVSPATTTSTEIGYVNGVTSAIQTQIDAKVSKSLYSVKGDVLAASAASTPVAVAVGANNTVLTADSAQATGVKWASVASLNNLAVTTKTTTYTATTADDVILIDTSAGAWQLTLYTAVGNSGKQLRIKKITTDANLLTIDGNASETIDGSLTTTLAVKDEVLVMVSDGTNWQKVERWYPRLFVAYTPTFTGFGSQTNVNFLSRRVGDSLEVRGSFTSGTSTGTEARITLGYNGTNANVTSKSGLPTTSIAGFAAYSVSHAGVATALIESSVNYLTFGVQGASNGGTTKVNGNVFTASGTTTSFTAMIPINGWAE